MTQTVRKHLPIGSPRTSVGAATDGGKKKGSGGGGMESSQLQRERPHLAIS